jgi:hypothetical protein
MNVAIFPNFLEANICWQMNEWIKIAVKNKWLDVGLDPSVESWGYKKRLTSRKYYGRFEYPKIVYDVSDRITNFLGLQNYPKSINGGRGGIVVSCTKSGGDVYLHKDPMENNLHVLRCNIMTSSASSGGELYIGGKKINIKTGDLHCYLPSDVEHYVTENTGERARIMWMFGYQMSKEDFQSKFFKQ